MKQILRLEGKNMRNGKKFAAVLAAGVLSASMCMPAMAASGVSAEEQKILNKMESSATGFGVTSTSLYASYYSQAESWLASGEVDLTAKQVEAVLKAVDQAAALLQDAIDANGAANASDLLNIIGKDGIMKIAQQIVDAIAPGLKEVGIVITADMLAGDSGVINVKLAKDGTTIGSSDKVIKKTGMNAGATFAVAAGLVTALVGCAVTAKKNNYRETAEEC